MISPMLNWRSTEHGQSEGVTLEWLGLIPAFVNAYDPTPAAKQIDNNYQHGGGWRHSLPGWKLDEQHVLRYESGEEPEDPPLQPLFHAQHDLGGGKMEDLYFYDSAWMCIVQEDGSFEVSRID